MSRLHSQEAGPPIRQTGPKESTEKGKATYERNKSHWLQQVPWWRALIETLTAIAVMQLLVGYSAAAQGIRLYFSQHAGKSRPRVVDPDPGRSGRR